jgi:pimeloyl-ACP methyl ester carboxylesterase
MRSSTVVVGLIGMILVGLAASWTAGSIMVKGRHSGVSAAVSPSQDVRFQSQDGVSIAATFRPGKNDRSPAVLLLHGVGASRQATAANAEWLATLGYATLAIDFRGHGESSSEQRTFGFDEALDAQTAFAWLKRQQGNAPVAIIGISLGGAASLLGDAGPIQADALILQAVYPDIRHAIRNRIASRTIQVVGDLLEPLLSFQAPLRFGIWPSRLSPLAALPRYLGPVLVIGGEQDRATPPAETRAMFGAVRGDRTLWMVPTGDHAEICDLADVAYRTHVAAFLARTIGKSV